MTTYEAIKINGKWYIQSLSICFKPILVFGEEYKSKASAVNAACDMSGFLHTLPHEKQAYIDHLASYKARIIRENHGIAARV